MYERRTNYPKSKEDKKVQSQKETPDPEGVGTIWRRDSSGREVSDPSSHSIPLEKGIRARSRDYPQGQKHLTRKSGECHSDFYSSNYFLIVPCIHIYQYSAFSNY